MRVPGLFFPFPALGSGDLKLSSALWRSQAVSGFRLDQYQEPWPRTAPSLALTAAGCTHPASELLCPGKWCCSSSSALADTHGVTQLCF